MLLFGCFCSLFFCYLGTCKLHYTYTIRSIFLKEYIGRLPLFIHFNKQMCEKNKNVILLFGISFPTPSLFLLFFFALVCVSHGKTSHAQIASRSKYMLSFQPLPSISYHPNERKQVKILFQKSSIQVVM